jgi:hypothetical protein
MSQLPLLAHADKPVSVRATSRRDRATSWQHHVELVEPLVVVVEMDLENLAPVVASRLD